jgi:hypothetical protein
MYIYSIYVDWIQINVLNDIECYIYSLYHCRKKCSVTDIPHLAKCKGSPVICQFCLMQGQYLPIEVLNNPPREMHPCLLAPSAKENPASAVRACACRLGRVSQL